MKPRFVVLALLTILAGWLRFTATSFGLPETFRPDEEYIISRAWGFERSWNPNFAIYPAAQMYVDHLALFLNARLRGERGNFRQAYYSFDSVYLLVRRVSAGFGTATIPAIYFAAAPLGPATALGASALMAAATLHVRESKYATTDAGAVFWITIGLAMIVRMALTGKGRYYLAAGLVAGFAIATKYPAGILIPAIAVAHLEARVREGRSLWRSFRDIRIYVAGLGTIIAFVCGTPYFFLDWAQTTNDYVYQRGFVLDGLPNPLATYGLRWLFLHAAPASFGIVMMALFLVAMLWMALRPRLATYPLLVFVLAACASMTRSRYVFYRYLVFPLPALIILAAAFLADFYGLVTPNTGGVPPAYCFAPRWRCSRCLHWPGISSSTGCCSGRIRGSWRATGSNATSRPAARSRSATSATCAASRGFLPSTIGCRLNPWTRCGRRMSVGWSRTACHR